jgi:hypothetical protein
VEGETVKGAEANLTRIATLLAADRDCAAR